VDGDDVELNRWYVSVLEQGMIVTAMFCCVHRKRWEIGKFVVNKKPR